MGIFCVEKVKDYTTISNYHLRDKRLSLKAKGLLTMILALPEDWNFTGTVKYYAQIHLQVWQNSVCTGQENLPLIT